MPLPRGRRGAEKVASQATLLGAASTQAFWPLKTSATWTAQPSPDWHNSKLGDGRVTLTTVYTSSEETVSRKERRWSERAVRATWHRVK